MVWFGAVEVTADRRILIALPALRFRRSVELEVAGNLACQFVVFRSAGDDERPASPVIRFPVAALCRAGGSQSIEKVWIDVVGQFATTSGK